ncbi:hypothetical protein HD593_000614 [Nonomuraea rubra]|uniref:Uncharacterized protein n=2 Tax=Nonomuraea rubra TaxID=46180 RepID=A0A7X0TW53_9ACTN|nr:hypothetical protein [Nonomuraea rubra]
MATGGPQVRAAGQKALGAGTPEALEAFLVHGWAVASARDDETATLEDLLGQAKAAAALAAQETANATSEADRARDAAAAARRSAAEAAKATEAARENMAEVKAQAKRAAQKAAEAAQMAAKANQKAAEASVDATWAIASYEIAVDAANRASAAAQSAYRSVNEAGLDAEAAVAAANEAYEAYEYAAGVEIAKCGHEYTRDDYAKLEDLYGLEEGGFYSNCIENVIGNPEDLATRAYINSAFCDIYPQDSQSYENCINSTLDPAFEGMQRYALTFQALKNAYTAARTGSDAVSEIQIGLIRSKEQLVLAHVRAVEASLHSAGNYTAPSGTAFFWSGRSPEGDAYVYAGPDKAAEIAKGMGGTTLERLMDSRGIPQATWGSRDMDWDPAEVPWDAIKDQVDALWKRVSLAYARNASGDVRVILGAEVRSTSVWKPTECFELLANPNVTEITIIDLTTGKEVRVVSDRSQC